MQSKTNNYVSHRALFRTVGYLILIAVAITAFIPFYTMVISSTHDNYNITTQFNLKPGTELVRNYLRLIENVNIWRGFANSVFLATTNTLLILYFSAMTAYAFSKFHFRGRKVLFSIIVVTMMLPGQLGIIGFYKLVSDMRLINSYIPLIIPAIANCFSVFFFKQYLDGSLPDDLIEAAIVDGCGEMKLLHRIVIPAMMPALVTQGVLTFIGAWNSYLQPLIILNEVKKQTLPVLIATIKSAYGADYGAQYVGIMISIAPLLIIFFFTSKMLMDKISVSAAIKG